jgi:hypothetical protein
MLYYNYFFEVMFALELLFLVCKCERVMRIFCMHLEQTADGSSVFNIKFDTASKKIFKIIKKLKSIDGKKRKRLSYTLFFVV